MGIADELPARRDWHGLPGDYYHSEAAYAAELARIWHAGWLFAVPACEVGRPGDFVTVPVGDASILVLRGDDGELRAFHNVCPHRGMVLCDADHGHAGPLLVCPYHQWTFGRDGQLHRCRGMHDLDPAGLGLRPVALVEVAGLVFVSLADAPPDPGPLRRRFAAAEPHGFDRARVAHAIDYRVAANWKLVWENNRECYHCDAGHPQYVRANFDIAEAERDTPAARADREAILARAAAYWDAEGLSVKHTAGGLARFPDPDDPDPFPISATRTVQRDGFETESMDGGRVAPFMGALRSPETGVLRLRSLPGFWCHASCDHAVLTRVLPESRTTTRLRVTWLVDAAAEEHTDYSLPRLLPFWQLTSEQDWRLCERVARGVASPGYRPGPLSRRREYNLEAFFLWYLRRLG